MARETVRRLATVSQMFGSFIIAVYVFFVLITPIPSISELFTSFLGFPHMICSWQPKVPAPTGTTAITRKWPRRIEQLNLHHNVCSIQHTELMPSHTVYTIPLKIWCKFMLVTTHSEIQMVSLILLVKFWKSFYAIQLTFPRKRETSCEVSLGEVASGIWGRWSWWPHVQMWLSSHWLCWQGRTWWCHVLYFFWPLQRGWCITLGRGVSWQFWYHFTILSRFKVYPTSSRYLWWKMMENDPMLNQNFATNLVFDAVLTSVI